MKTFNFHKERIKVLVPAMERRGALAAARSLGKKGIEIIGCSHKKQAAGFFSKYCQKCSFSK